MKGEKTLVPDSIFDIIYKVLSSYILQYHKPNISFIFNCCLHFNLLIAVVEAHKCMMYIYMGIYKSIICSSEFWIAESRRMRTDCKVYVGNLGNTEAKHELESAFSKYGPLVNVWVARNPPGFAFVEFEDPRDAEDAVRALDGT